MLILALTRLGQTDNRPPPTAPATIVWLDEIRTEQPAPPPAPAGERASPQKNEEMAPPAAAARSRPIQTRPSPTKTSAHPAETSSRPAETNSGPQAPAGPAVSTPHIDLEALRHRVAEQLVARQARGFSTAPLDGVSKETGPEDPEAWHAVWTAAFEGRVSGGCDGCGEPTLLHAGQQRTRIGRLAAGLCQSLLGGGSFFGLFSLCGSYDSGPDLDSPIRPGYLKKRPLCGQIAPQQRAAALAAGADSIPSAKCRLVDDAEREAILKRASENSVATHRRSEGRAVLKDKETR
ncbi:MAG TPA: hypothetical protein VFY39_15410 [Gammaproteobacteria bacterium]|nr:hypothetical protein [Gammaproteobacteria bacterium]